ncbi:MAG: D-glycerate dehydrogenase [Candidatus Aminicenantales bacterium]
MKPKVLITHTLLPEALAYLKAHVNYEIASEQRIPPKEILLQKIKETEGLLSLLTVKIDKEIIKAAPRLRIIANCAVGYDNIDLAFAREKGILVTNTPGVLTEATADLTWALILATARKIPQADTFTKEKKFKGWELDLFLGREITGKRLGIIGMGRIGRAVALRACAFRMEIVYTDRRKLSTDEEKKYRASFLPLDGLLASSDIITVHASLTLETHHLISREKIRLMKKEAILVNVARGPIVDERALVEALEKGRIWGAGLDVYEREPEIESRLFKCGNVILLPHIGSATYETRLRMAMTAARNLVQGLRGEKPENLVS